MFGKLNLVLLTLLTASFIFLLAMSWGQISSPRLVFAEDSCVTPPPGMIGWWPGDGNGDDIRFGNDGTLINGTSFATGMVDDAFNFDGIDDGVLVPDTAVHNFGADADFSIDAWIQITPNAPDPSTNHFTIVSKRYAPTIGGMTTGFELFLYDGKLGVQLADDSDANGYFRNFFSYSPDLRDGNFHHVAVTVDRNNAQGGRLFVDGQIVRTFDTTLEAGDLSTTEPLRFGIHATDGFDAFFNGLIDEVELFNRALTPDEINAIYSADSAGKCKNVPFPTDCAIQTDIPQAECETLVVLYNSTDGPYWTTNTGWNVTDTPCSWSGIGCNGGNVQQIDLRSNQLNGALPDLSALSKLKFLWLGSNQLSGSIPDLSALTSIQWLFLNNNNLTGSIPNLSTLVNLEELRMDNNLLNGTIPDLSVHPNLRLLYLENNHLTGSIPDLSGLTSLKWFDLSNNQLTGSIPDLSALTNLQYLNMDNNQLSGSIPDLSALTNLQYLYLNNNQLSNAIPDLSTLTNLGIIYLNSNQLSGSIPDLSALPNLLQLYLDNNQLSGIVPLSICQKTLFLDLGYNKLEVNTADSCVDTADPDWKTTQTVPPLNVTAVPFSSSEIQLSWTPIAYSQDGGSYSVWGKEPSDPSYTLMATTADKTSSGVTVSGLQPETTYEFVVRTVTPAHGDQQNELTSVDSAMATAVTHPTQTYSVYLPWMIRSAPFQTVMINDAAIPSRPVTAVGEIFFLTQVAVESILPTGGTFYLSSSPSAPTAAKVDDRVVLLLNNVELFSYTYGQPNKGVKAALVEIPRSVMEQLAGKTVTIEFRDVYGDKVSATALYMIWSP